MRGLPVFDRGRLRRWDFFAGFLRPDDPAAFVVINMRPLIGPDGRLWLPRIGASGECLMVMSDGERSLTAAYAQIKQACQPGDAGYGECRPSGCSCMGADGERVKVHRLSPARRHGTAVPRRHGRLCRQRAIRAAGRHGGQRARGRRTAEAGRVYLRLATDLPGWRLAECNRRRKRPGLAH